LLDRGETQNPWVALVSQKVRGASGAKGNEQRDFGFGDADETRLCVSEPFKKVSFDTI
jgi:hypothetical protein